MKEIMKLRFRMFRRQDGIFYFFDRETGQRRTLGTAERPIAQRLINAKNEGQQQPLINRQIARAYVSVSEHRQHSICVRTLRLAGGRIEGRASGRQADGDSEYPGQPGSRFRGRGTANVQIDMHSVLESLALRDERSIAGRTGESKRDLLLDVEELLRDANAIEGDAPSVAEQQLLEAEEAGILKLEPLHKRDRSSLHQVRFNPANEAKLFASLIQTHLAGCDGRNHQDQIWRD